MSPKPVEGERGETGGAPAHERWFTLACYATAQLALLGWWLAFHPGLMSPDSVTYVAHVTTGPWVAGQSVAYDALLGFSLRVTGDLSPVTLLQTVAMAAALTHLAGAIRSLGVRGRPLLVAVGCAALSPPLGAFTVAMWKDVPFTVCAVLAAGTAVRLATRPGARGGARSRGRGAARAVVWDEDRVGGAAGTVVWDEDRVGGAAGTVVRDADGKRGGAGRGDGRWGWDPRFAALGAELLGLGLFRNNGFLVASIAAALLVALLSGRPGARRWVAALAAGAVAAPLLLLGIGYPAMGIAPPSRSFAYQTVFGDLAVAYERRPRLFDREQRALLAGIAPLDVWRRGATCQTMAGVFFDPGFGHARAEERISDVLELWRGLLVRAPGMMLGTRICRAALAWQVGSTSGEPGGELYRFSLRDPRLPEGWQGTPAASVMRQRPISDGLLAAGVFALDASTVRQLEWLLWRAPFWCYLAYATAALVWWRTGSRAALAGAAVVAGQQIGVILTNTAPDFRFMVTPIFVGVLFVPLLLREVRPSRPVDERDL
ncbi:hypothetical protein [Streptosporangium vulgare]|uniref:Glycosyltransferase RgtA/B/C/D-like domain-containing protein n=1 Tax=Streptosporangium vulgare TaxID=46190 RepID=A0ABV5THJ1_9ACTN